jgi:hypothetical protein
MDLIAINYDEVVPPGYVGEGAPVANWVAKLDSDAKGLQRGSLEVGSIPHLSKRQSDKVCLKEGLYLNAMQGQVLMC